MSKRRNMDVSKRYKHSQETMGGTREDIFDWNKLDVSVSFYTPKPTDGYRNKIIIVPYEIKSKNHPLVRNGTFKVGDYDYVMDVYVHQKVGPGEKAVVCLKENYGRSCPICEKAQEFRKQDNEEEYKALKPSRRVYYNVLDAKRNEDDGDKILVFHVSYYLFEKLLIKNSIDEGVRIDFANVDKAIGKVIGFYTEEVQKGAFKFNEHSSFKFFKRREVISEEVLDAAVSFDDLMRVHTYTEIEGIMYGDEGEEEELEDDVEKDKAETVKKKSKKNKKKVCPNGYRFNEDAYEYDECENCDLSQECE